VDKQEVESTGFGFSIRPKKAKAHPDVGMSFHKVGSDLLSHQKVVPSAL
jgi:hypothetical protein